MAITVREMLAEKPVNAIYAIRTHHTVLEGLRIMAKHNIGSVLVLDDDDRLAGIFTERDYARKGILKGMKAKSTEVSEVMTAKLVTVGLDESIRECLQKMSAGKFRHLPVLDGGELRGLLSVSDLVKARIEEQRNHIQHLQSMIAG